ncbi:MAG: sulfatase [Phycisphaerae bacterium]
MIFLALLAQAAPTYAAQPAKTPNILILYADDLGHGDLSCYGAKDIRTPAIDSLARSGIRFTNYYCAAPLCAPSRAAMLTGRTPARAGMALDKNIPPEPGSPGMPGEQITLAELVKPAGYATALIGKWHLGSSPETLPNAQGFDYFFGFHASLTDYFMHTFTLNNREYHDLYRNGEQIHRDGEHMTDLIAEESLAFIEAHRREPFLLFVSFNAPHYPVQPQQKWVDAYRDLPEPRRGHVALVAGMDEAIARILRKLDELNLADNTFVLFTSDNGAAAASPRGEGGGRNTPFREHKRSLFDGGSHVPAIVRWPGHVPEKQTRDQLAIEMDVFPTVADVTGAKPPAGRTLDGRSWVPLFEDPKATIHEMLFLEWDGQAAIRQGKWKLVRNGLVDLDVSRTKRAAPPDDIFLANVESDPGERKNLRDQHPEIVTRLMAAWEKWRSSLERD